MRKTTIRKLKIMMKFFIRRQFTAKSSTGYDRTDPLSHPLVQRMSPRELADLPFNRR